MYICISTLHCSYYGSCGLKTDTYDHVIRADTLDLLYEAMGKRKADCEEDHGGSERSWVKFGEIMQISGTITPDPNRIIASQAWQKRLADEIAEKEAEEAEEKRREEAYEAALLAARQTFILSYSDSMYPEDNRIIGIYDTEAKAEATKQSEIESWKRSHGSENHHAFDYNYSITEMERV